MYHHRSLLRALALVGLCAGQGGPAVAAPTITIIPSPVFVSPGEAVQLRAQVHGPSEYRVKWILQGPMMEGTDVGILTQDGVYTAPRAMPMGPIRIVAQISLGQWNLPVAAASVPVQVVPEGAKPPEMTPSPPPPAPPMPFGSEGRAYGAPPQEPSPPPGY
jgi:hypothetical protein